MSDSGLVASTNVRRNKWGKSPGPWVDHSADTWGKKRKCPSKEGPTGSALLPLTGHIVLPPCPDWQVGEAVGPTLDDRRKLGPAPRPASAVCVFFLLRLDRSGPQCYSTRRSWAHSSVGEHIPHTDGVVGSIPTAPTQQKATVFWTVAFLFPFVLFNPVCSPHNSWMGFIALPKGGKLFIYDLRHSAPVIVADTGFGVGRHADDTLPSGRFPVVVRQHTSTSGDTLAVLYYRQAGIVVLFDMATGVRVREIPTPPDVCPQSVLLLGNRLFVGGHGWLGEFDLEAESPSWETVGRPSFTIDKLAFTDSRLWAASSRFQPAHLEAFAAKPPDGQSGEKVLRDVDPTLEDFACGDTHLAVVMRPASQGRQSSAPRVFLYDVNEVNRPRIEVRTPGQEIHVDHVNLLGDRVFAAGRLAGLCVADISLSVEDL